MRALAIVLVVLVIAVTVIALFYMCAVAPAARTGSPDGAGSERIDSLELAMLELQQRIERLNSSVDALEGELAILGERIEKAPPAHGEAPHAASPRPREAEGPERAGDAEKDAPTADAGEPEHLRRIVRQEIERAEEERKKRLEEERRASRPEEWETKEFGGLAWQVHRMGTKLGLSDDQKRQYHEIIKDNQAATSSLWQELRNKFPDSDWRQLSESYRERSKELMRDARDQVTRILNKKQQQEYKKLYKDNEWFK